MPTENVHPLQRLAREHVGRNLVNFSKTFAHEGIGNILNECGTIQISGMSQESGHFASDKPFSFKFSIGPRVSMRQGRNPK
jgi:hypothetical protein